MSLRAEIALLEEDSGDLLNFISLSQIGLKANAHSDTRFRNAYLMAYFKADEKDFAGVNLPCLHQSAF